MYLKEYSQNIKGDEKVFHAIVTHLEESELAKVTIFMDQDFVETSRLFNFAEVAGYQKFGHNEGYLINGLGDTVKSLDAFMQAYFLTINGNQ